LLVAFGAEAFAVERIRAEPAATLARFIFVEANPAIFIVVGFHVFDRKHRPEFDPAQAIRRYRAPAGPGYTGVDRHGPSDEFVAGTWGIR
jgi:hypothetical protein